jgi:two-component sensor histidine kinase
MRSTQQQRTARSRFRTTYQATDWQLAVSDNGSGKPDGVFAQPKTGLAAGVVKALSKQLDAQVVTMSGALGTKVSVTHATFAAAYFNRPAAADSFRPLPLMAPLRHADGR